MPGLLFLLPDLVGPMIRINNLWLSKQALSAGSKDKIVSREHLQKLLHSIIFSCFISVPYVSDR